METSITCTLKCTANRPHASYEGGSPHGDKDQDVDGQGYELSSK